MSAFFSAFPHVRMSVKLFSLVRNCGFADLRTNLRTCPALFVCLWDSIACNKHYIEKAWPQSIGEEEGQNNVVALPLVTQNKIILPPLYIKLGLFKQFVKGLRKDFPAFECFPKLSDAKIEVVFVGTQIRKLILNDMFDKTLKTDKAARKSSEQVCLNFLG